MKLSDRAYRLLNRALVTAGRYTAAAQRLVAELAIAAYDEDLGAVSAEAYYQKDSNFRANQVLSRGLLPFEVRMLKQFFPRPPAKLLLHGAGTGRELFALLEQGYQVDAFEPVPSFVVAAQQLITPRHPATVQQASAQEWARKPEGRYEGVIAGWGMWTHLLALEDRLAVLRAFRAVCSEGPLLISFWRREAVFDQEEGTGSAPLPVVQDRVTRFARAFLRERVLTRPPLEADIQWANGLFYHLVSRATLDEEAERTGWRVAFYERDGSKYPHAILLPR